MLLGFCMGLYRSAHVYQHSDKPQYKNQTLFPALESQGTYSVSSG